MRVFGHDTMTVSARAVIQRETTGMELALVMDNTGSMYGSGVHRHVQTAAVDLVDILYGDETVIDNLWVSLVPYVASVNIGPSRTDWLNVRPIGCRPRLSATLPTSAPWKGCVMAQAYPLRQQRHADLRSKNLTSGLSMPRPPSTR